MSTPGALGREGRACSAWRQTHTHTHTHTQVLTGAPPTEVERGRRLTVCSLALPLLVCVCAHARVCVWTVLLRYNTHPTAHPSACAIKPFSGYLQSCAAITTPTTSAGNLVPQPSLCAPSARGSHGVVFSRFIHAVAMSALHPYSSVQIHRVLDVGVVPTVWPS